MPFAFGIFGEEIGGLLQIAGPQHDDGGNREIPGPVGTQIPRFIDSDKPRHGKTLAVRDIGVIEITPDRFYNEVCGIHLT